MSTLSALYSRIQLVPDLDRSEVINLGVAMYCQDLDYFDALYVGEDDKTTLTRLTKFAPSVDFVEIGKNLTAIRAYLQSVAKIGRDQLEQALDQFGPQIVLNDLQPLLSEDPAVDLERLYKQLIVAPRGKSRSTRPYVSTALKSLFIERNLISHYEPRTIEVHKFPVRLDLVERNHASTVFKGFRLENDVASFDTATKWNYTFKALRESRDYRDANIIAVCEKDGSSIAEEVACILSENTGVEVVDVREEQRILQFAQIGSAS